MSPDGSLAVRMSATGTPEHAADLGARLATDMLADGAGELTDAPVETVRRQ
jgi:hydroxymethylbilane synthase